MHLGRFLLGWRKMGIKRSDLVLEIGSGNRPIARSDVLCDLGEYGQNTRYGGRVLNDIVMDRPFVIGDAHRLPFRDRSFDYLIAAHVLEHLERPDLFLHEACRVSQRGCIITPSAIFEKIFAEPSHFWYVTIADGRLRIQAKEPDDHGIYGSRFRELWAENRHLRKFLSSRHDVFEISYFYSNGRINFDIEGTFSFSHGIELDDDIEHTHYMKRFLIAKVRSSLGRAVRLFASRRTVILNGLLACPVCSEVASLEANFHVRCQGCGKRYPLRKGNVPVMLASQAE